MPRGSGVGRPPREAPSPAPLRREAFQGLPGEIVATIEPQTEGHPAALLLQLLVAFGFVVGRRPFYGVEADRHFPNLFVILVGDTSKSRKGTTWSWIERLFQGVKGWPSERVKNGLSSGEGLIEQVSADLDKRLLIVEGEFSTVLQVLLRTGNTLSAQLRNAWDSKPLSILTKHAPANAPDGHICFIAHITADEVRRLMTANETGNGFANRFLWCHVERANVLPDGGAFIDAELRPLVARLSAAVQWASKLTSRIEFDTDAHARWCEVYEQLSEGRTGVSGKVTSRGEAQVVRLALVYALLDRSPVICIRHLNAALAVWDYCEESARHVFGDSLGNRIADELLTVLRRQPQGLTRSEISDHFKRHRSSMKIGEALALLESRSLACREVIETRGRPIERWYAIVGSLKASVDG